MARGDKLKTKARGLREAARLKIACRFDDTTFSRIKRMAQREGKSFSAMAVECAKVGVNDLEESDALEVPFTPRKDPRPW